MRTDIQKRKENWIKYFAIFVIYLLLGTGINVLAQEPETTPIDYTNPASINDNLKTADYSKITDWKTIDPSKIPLERYDDKNIKWDQLDQSQIPATNIGQIPREHVNVAQVKDPSRLTALQLAHEKDGKANIELIQDISTLNPQELVVTIRSAYAISAEVQASPGSRIVNGVLSNQNGQEMNLRTGVVTINGEEISTVATDPSIDVIIVTANGFEFVRKKDKGDVGISVQGDYTKADVVLKDGELAVVLDDGQAVVVAGDWTKDGDLYTTTVKLGRDNIAIVSVKAELLDQAGIELLESEGTLQIQGEYSLFVSTDSGLVAKAVGFVEDAKFTYRRDPQGDIFRGDSLSQVEVTDKFGITAVFSNVEATYREGLLVDALGLQGGGKLTMAKAEMNIKENARIRPDYGDGTLRGEGRDTSTTLQFKKAYQSLLRAVKAGAKTYKVNVIVDGKNVEQRISCTDAASCLTALRNAYKNSKNQGLIEGFDKYLRDTRGEGILHIAIDTDAKEVKDFANNGALTKLVHETYGNMDKLSPNALITLDTSAVGNNGLYVDALSDGVIGDIDWNTDKLDTQGREVSYFTQIVSGKQQVYLYVKDGENWAPFEENPSIPQTLQDKDVNRFSIKSSYTKQGEQINGRMDIKSILLSSVLYDGLGNLRPGLVHDKRDNVKIVEDRVIEINPQSLGLLRFAAGVSSLGDPSDDKNWLINDLDYDGSSTIGTENLQTELEEFRAQVAATGKTLTQTLKRTTSLNTKIIADSIGLDITNPRNVVATNIRNFIEGIGETEGESLAIATIKSEIQGSTLTRDQKDGAEAGLDGQLKLENAKLLTGEAREDNRKAARIDLLKFAEKINTVNSYMEAMSVISDSFNQKASDPFATENERDQTAAQAAEYLKENGFLAKLQASRDTTLAQYRSNFEKAQKGWQDLKDLEALIAQGRIRLKDGTTPTIDSLIDKSEAEITRLREILRQVNSKRVALPSGTTVADVEKAIREIQTQIRTLETQKSGMLTLENGQTRSIVSLIKDRQDYMDNLRGAQENLEKFDAQKEYSKVLANAYIQEARITRETGFQDNEYVNRVLGTAFVLAQESRDNNILAQYYGQKIQLQQKIDGKDFVVTSNKDYQDLIKLVADPRDETGLRTETIQSVAGVLALGVFEESDTAETAKAKWDARLKELKIDSPLLRKQGYDAAVDTITDQAQKILLLEESRKLQTPFLARDLTKLAAAYSANDQYELALKTSDEAKKVTGQEALAKNYDYRNGYSAYDHIQKVNELQRRDLYDYMKLEETQQREDLIQSRGELFLTTTTIKSAGDHQINDVRSILAGSYSRTNDDVKSRALYDTMSTKITADYGTSLKDGKSSYDEKIRETLAKQYISSEQGKIQLDLKKGSITDLRNAKTTAINLYRGEQLILNEFTDEQKESTKKILKQTQQTLTQALLKDEQLQMAEVEAKEILDLDQNPADKDKWARSVLVSIAQKHQENENEDIVVRVLGDLDIIFGGDGQGRALTPQEKFILATAKTNQKKDSEAESVYNLINDELEEKTQKGEKITGMQKYYWAVARDKLKKDSQSLWQELTTAQDVSEAIRTAASRQVSSIVVQEAFTRKDYRTVADEYQKLISSYETEATTLESQGKTDQAKRLRTTARSLKFEVTSMEYTLGNYRGASQEIGKLTEAEFEAIIQSKPTDQQKNFRNMRKILTDQENLPRLIEIQDEIARLDQAKKDHTFDAKENTIKFGTPNIDLNTAIRQILGAEKSAIYEFWDQNSNEFLERGINYDPVKGLIDRRTGKPVKTPSDYAFTLPARTRVEGYKLVFEQRVLTGTITGDTKLVEDSRKVMEILDQTVTTGIDISTLDKTQAGYVQGVIKFVDETTADYIQSTIVGSIIRSRNLEQFESNKDGTVLAISLLDKGHRSTLKTSLTDLINSDEMVLHTTNNVDFNLNVGAANLILAQMSENTNERLQFLGQAKEKYRDALADIPRFIPETEDTNNPFYASTRQELKKVLEFEYQTKGITTSVPQSVDDTISASQNLKRRDKWWAPLTFARTREVDLFRELDETAKLGVLMAQKNTEFEGKLKTSGALDKKSRQQLYLNAAEPFVLAESKLLQDDSVDPTVKRLVTGTGYNIQSLIKAAQYKNGDLSAQEKKALDTRLAVMGSGPKDPNVEKFVYLDTVQRLKDRAVTLEQQAQQARDQAETEAGISMDIPLYNLLYGYATGYIGVLEDSQNTVINNRIRNDAATDVAQKAIESLNGLQLTKRQVAAIERYNAEVIVPHVNDRNERVRNNADYLTNKYSEGLGFMIAGARTYRNFIVGDADQDYLKVQDDYYRNKENYDSQIRMTEVAHLNGYTYNELKILNFQGKLSEALTTYTMFEDGQEVNLQKLYSDDENYEVIIRDGRKVARYYARDEEGELVALNKDQLIEARSQGRAIIDAQQKQISKKIPTKESVNFFTSQMESAWASKLNHIVTVQDGKLQIARDINLDTDMDTTLLTSFDNSGFVNTVFSPAAILAGPATGMVMGSAARIVTGVYGKVVDKLAVIAGKGLGSTTGRLGTLYGGAARLGELGLRFVGGAVKYGSYPIRLPYKLSAQLDKGVEFLGGAIRGTSGSLIRRLTAGAFEGVVGNLGVQHFYEEGILNVIGGQFTSDLDDVFNRYTSLGTMDFAELAEGALTGKGGSGIAQNLQQSIVKRLAVPIYGTIDVAISNNLQAFQIPSDTVAQAFDKSGNEVEIGSPDVDHILITSPATAEKVVMATPQSDFVQKHQNNVVATEGYVATDTGYAYVESYQGNFQDQVEALSNDEEVSDIKIDLDRSTVSYKMNGESFIRAAKGQIPASTVTTEILNRNAEETNSQNILNTISNNDLNLKVNSRRVMLTSQGSAEVINVRGSSADFGNLVNALENQGYTVNTQDLSNGRVTATDANGGTVILNNKLLGVAEGDTISGIEVLKDLGPTAINTQGYIDSEGRTQKLTTVDNDQFKKIVRNARQTNKEILEDKGDHITFLEGTTLHTVKRADSDYELAGSLKQDLQENGLNAEQAAEVEKTAVNNKAKAAKLLAKYGLIKNGQSAVPQVINLLNSLRQEIQSKNPEITEAQQNQVLRIATGESKAYSNAASLQQRARTLARDQQISEEQAKQQIFGEMAGLSYAEIAEIINLNIARANSLRFSQSKVNIAYGIFQQILEIDPQNTVALLALMQMNQDTKIRLALQQKVDINEITQEEINNALTAEGEIDPNLDPNIVIALQSRINQLTQDLQTEENNENQEHLKSQIAGLQIALNNYNVVILESGIETKEAAEVEQVPSVVTTPTEAQAVQQITGLNEQSDNLQLQIDALQIELAQSESEGVLNFELRRELNNLALRRSEITAQINFLQADLDRRRLTVPEVTLEQKQAAFRLGQVLHGLYVMSENGGTIHINPRADLSEFGVPQAQVANFILYHEVFHTLYNELVAQGAVQIVDIETEELLANDFARYLIGQEVDLSNFQKITQTTPELLFENSVEVDIVIATPQDMEVALETARTNSDLVRELSRTSDAILRKMRVTELSDIYNLQNEQVITLIGTIMQLDPTQEGNIRRSLETIDGFAITEADIISQLEIIRQRAEIQAATEAANQQIIDQFRNEYGIDINQFGDQLRSSVIFILANDQSYNDQLATLLEDIPKRIVSEADVLPSLQILESRINQQQTLREQQRETRVLVKEASILNKRAGTIMQDYLNTIRAWVERFAQNEILTSINNELNQNPEAQIPIHISSARGVQGILNSGFLEARDPGPSTPGEGVYVYVYQQQNGRNPDRVNILTRGQQAPVFVRVNQPTTDRFEAQALQGYFANDIPVDNLEFWDSTYTENGQVKPQWRPVTEYSYTKFQKYSMPNSKVIADVASWTDTEVQTAIEELQQDPQLLPRYQEKLQAMREIGYDQVSAQRIAIAEVGGRVVLENALIRAEVDNAFTNLLSESC